MIYIVYNGRIINHKRRLKMGTRNKIMFDKTLERYKKSGQIIIEDGQLTILEQDTEKRNKIMWQLASYSPQFALQMFDKS